jgi:hypothetical protein
VPALTFVPHTCKAALGLGSLAALHLGVDTEFSLTFEAQAAGLQPVLEVDDRRRMRAAAIVEKEQEYVVEAAQPAQSRVQWVLYISENGCAFTTPLFILRPIH